MYPPMIARPPVPVLAVLAGGVVLASVPPMAGCGRSRAARGAPVPASAIGLLTAIGRLTAIARRAAGGNGEPRQERMEGAHHR
jgi:hypothetical protein